MIFDSDVSETFIANIFCPQFPQRGKIVPSLGPFLRIYMRYTRRRRISRPTEHHKRDLEKSQQYASKQSQTCMKVGFWMLRKAFQFGNEFKKEMLLRADSADNRMLNRQSRIQPPMSASLTSASILWRQILSFPQLRLLKLETP